MNSLGYLLAFSLCSGSVLAVPIVIGTGNPGNQGTDNVLFNDSSLQHSGVVVEGNFAGEGSGYVINFTSASGNGELLGSGGQAEITGHSGNDPLTDLTFSLAQGATFTKAIFNVDAVNDGFLTITVNYLLASGSPYEELVTIGGSGQNFFNVNADDGAVITSINLLTVDTELDSIRQFRLGGFANAIGVPDGGSTAIMLGLGFLGLVGLRRKV